MRNPDVACTLAHVNGNAPICRDMATVLWFATLTLVADDTDGYNWRAGRCSALGGAQLLT